MREYQLLQGECRLLKEHVFRCGIGKIFPTVVAETLNPYTRTAPAMYVTGRPLLAQQNTTTGLLLEI